MTAAQTTRSYQGPVFQDGPNGTVADRTFTLVRNDDQVDAQAGTRELVRAIGEQPWGSRQPPAS